METLRILTLNLWGEQPPLERRMELLAFGIQALAPDVVCLQEVRQIEGALPNQAETLAARFGFHVAFARAVTWGGGDEGLAILSNLPIAHRAHRELPGASGPGAKYPERRVVLGAAIVTPAGELPVFTTHLNYRLDAGLVREEQVAAADAFTGDWLRERPTALPRILAGDFNATADSDEIRFLCGRTTLEGRRTYWQDAWERLHPGEHGWTWARRNRYTERLGWLDRDRRIDYVFVSPQTRDGRGELRACRIVLDEPDSEGCFASDHFGVLAELQIAPRAA